MILHSQMNMLETYLNFAYVYFLLIDNIVKCGDTVRLENSNTRKNIYAAGFQSAISNKMEVTKTKKIKQSRNNNF